MNYLLKARDKVTELLKQPPDEVDEFKKDCTRTIDILQSRAVDETSKLKLALTNISRGLLLEINKGNYIRFDYFVQEQILSKIANEINSELPSEHLEPVLKFFLSFINTNLNSQIAQVSIHSPITKLLSKLETLDHKCPKETRDFAVEVWEACCKKPILLDIMSIQKGDIISFPLLDFFCSASMTLTEIGLKSRAFLLVLFNNNKDENNQQNVMPESFGKYVCQHLYPQLVEFLQAVSGYASTIQFHGSMTSTIQWLDDLFLVAGGFPMQNVINSFSDLPPFKRNLAVSFYLSFFTSNDVKKPVLEYATSQTHIKNIIFCMNSENAKDQKSSIILLKTLLTIPESFPSIFPPISKSHGDILSLIPPQWLVKSEGASSTEAYVTDATNRICSYTSRPQIDEKNSNNSIIYSTVLSMFQRFSLIAIHVALELTKLLSMFMAIAPDLIDAEFAETFKTVVSHYCDVESISNEIKDDAIDSPELRASILAEFGKEIHATFIASEKMDALNSYSKEE